MAKPKITLTSPPEAAANGFRIPRSVTRMGVLPATVYPDNWVNLENAGNLFTLTLEDGYLLVPSGTTRRSRILNGGPYTHIAIAGIASVWDVANDAIKNTCRWEVHWTQADQLYPVVDIPWVHGNHIFGTGVYPNYFAMPKVIEADHDQVITIRNSEAFDIRVYIELRCRRRYRSAVNTED